MRILRAEYKPDKHDLLFEQVHCYDNTVRRPRICRMFKDDTVLLI